MKINKTLFYLLSFSLAINGAYSEVTTSGPATYTNERGSFTYYDKFGEALPPGTYLELELDGRAGNVVNVEGEVVGRAYATKGLALYNREKDTMATTATKDEEGNIVAYDEEEYQKKSFELTSLLFGAAEIGAKYCKPAGDELPKSLASWFLAIKDYKAGESSRDKILNDRLLVIKSRMDDIINKKTNKDLQIEAIQFQIDMTNVTIDSIAGTNLFKGDENNEETAKTGRLPLREKLLIQALKSISLNGPEDLRYRETFYNRLLIAGLDNSLQIATDACNKTKTEKKCEEKKEGEEAKCTEEVVADPAEGCGEAIAKIPVIKDGLAVSYMELYLLPQIPSKDLNQKMLRLETQMQESMAAIPKSKDAKYDWHSPMVSGLEEMKIARKSSGAICPSTAKEGDYDASKSSLVAPEGEVLSVEGADKINESAKNFLSDMGISGDESVEATELFTKVWNTSDLIIGQSGERAKYYTEFADKIGELIEIDRTKLYELVTLQKKLTSYLAGIKSSLKQPLPSAGGASTPAKTVADSSKDTKVLAPVIAAESSAPKVSAITSINKVNSDQNRDQEIIFSQLANQGSLVKGLSKVRSSSGASGGSSGNTGRISAGNIQYGISFTGGNAAVAKKYVEEINRNNIKASYVERAQKKLVETAANNKKNTENKLTVAKTVTKTPEQTYSSSLNTSFAKLANSASAGSVYKRAAVSGLRSDNAELLTSATVSATESPATASAKLKAISLIKEDKKGKEVKKDDKKDDKKDAKKTAKKAPYRKRGKNTSVNYVYNPDSGTFSETVVATTPENQEFQESPVVSRESVEEKVSEDDMILADSIVAKRAKKKDAYDAKEEDSLFTRVTKAYIRNYEKVNKVPEE